MSFTPNINDFLYGEATTHNLDDIVDPPVSTGIGGLPPLGAGIAGINTPSRKFGGGRPGQEPSKKFGEYGLTKAQVATVRGMKNEYELKTGDKFTDGDTGYVWTVNENGGLEIVGSLNEFEWQVGDEVLFPEYEYDTVSDRRTMSGFETRIYEPQEEGGTSPWIKETDEPEVEVPVSGPIVLDDGTVLPPIITTPPPTPTPVSHTHLTLPTTPYV